MKDFRTYILSLCGKREGYVIEFKSAKGGFPSSVWDTYSSFSNTAGGIIVLGIGQKGEQFFLDGLTEEQIYKYKKIFWDGAHNAQMVNLCLLQEKDVMDESEGDAHYLVINIPRASYDQRPIYLKGDPFHGHTFRRNHEGDYHCSDEEVRQMMADSIVVKYGLDRRVIEGATIENDLDADTIRQYRNAFRARHDGHPWNDLTDAEFLSKVKGIAEDPQTGKVGITGAAILMFGKHESMYKAAPYFFVDFREKLSTDPRIRYTDRYYPDGTWEPNLYQFYNRVYRNMDQDIPHPFKLGPDMQRIDETPADESLREAICNTLIHCNWAMMGGVVIERYPDRHVFSNPGLMLVSKEDFFRGGKSICRNPYLQDMFIAVGRGEHLGSGADIIAKGWKENGWPAPELRETTGANTDGVELTLRIKKTAAEGDGIDDTKNVTNDVTKKLTERQRLIYNLLPIGDMENVTKKEQLSTTVLAAKFAKDPRTIKRDMKVLQELGLVEHVGPSNGGYWKRLK